MKKSIFFISLALSVFTLSSCGPDVCGGCVDYPGQLEVTNSENSTFFFQTPNAVSSFEEEISISILQQNNIGSLVPIDVEEFELILSDGNNILASINNIENPMNFDSNGLISMPISQLHDEISEASKLLDFNAFISNTSGATLTFDGKIQYVNCELFDLNEFNRADCRPTCTLTQPNIIGCNFCN